MLKKLWRLVTTQPAFAGLCLVAGAEAAMNAAFGFMSSPVLAFAVVLACIYAGAEMFKWKAAEITGEALAEGNKPRMAAAVLGLICCLAISLPAHIGFIGMMRDAVVQTRDTSAETRVNAKSELERVRADLAAIKTTRTAAEVALERDRYKENGGKWRRLEAERLAAERKAELIAKLDTLEGKLGDNNVSVADARVAVMKWIWPEAGDQDLQLALSVAVAIAIEAITAFGFIAIGTRRETLDLESLVAAGAVHIPGTSDILAFRGDVIQAAKGESLGPDELVAAYEGWCARAGKVPMQRAAFLRLFQALGGPQSGGRFQGVRLRPSFQLAIAN